MGTGQSEEQTVHLGRSVCIARDDVKHEIIAWAEHEALVQSGITSKDDLMARMVKDNALSFDASSAYFELVTRLASEKRYELQERLSGLDRKDQEIVRLKFATEMHEALHGAKAAADYSANLMRRWEKDFAFTAHEIQAGKLRDISELANSKKNKKLYSAYLQELNLRQNMAAASDIFRVIALKGKGGIYADLDLLPVSDGISEIQNTLRGKGFHISQDEGHIRGAITDSLITALKCIDGYQAGALHALDAREYFKSQNPDAVGYSDKQLDELKTVNEKRKAMIDAAVGEYLAGRSGQELAAIFNTVSDPAKTGFKGMGLGLSPKGGVINAFITAKKGNALITEVANKIAANYDFMKSIEELIKASALAKTDAEIGGLSEQIYTKLQQDYPDLVGAQLEGQFLRAMQSYMADGIAPGSMATVSISGPSVFLGVLLSKFGDDGDGVDERVVAKNAGVSGYSLDGADERASSWSNGDGMQRIAGIGDRNFLAKELHHVWLGSALRDKERDYAKLWAETNPDYSNQIWYDPDALAVNATKKEILRYAERLAAKELGGLDSPEHFIEEMRKNSQATRFIDASIRIASEKRFELNAMLEGAPAPERDGIRINFIASLRLESDGLDSAQRLKVQLLDDLARDRKVMQGKPNARNVHEVLDLPEFGVLKRAYELEMNLRQNMAAASDIARVVILKQLGGVYADVDLLPKFKLSFEEIKEKLRVNGYTLPETTGKSEGVLLTAITDAILEELGSITDYDASGAHKPPYGQPLEAGGDESVKNRHEEILRATARQIIADHQNRGGIFEPLGQMTPKTGGFLANAGNVYVNNNFMASQAGGDVISRLIEEMSKRYDFLLRGDVLETIKALAAGDPNGWTLTAELNKKYDALKREEGRESAKPSSFVGALSDYMADGMSQYAQATVKLSGPKVLLEVLSEFLGLPPSKQGKDAFEEFLTTKLNGYASDAQDSSWLVHNLDELFDKTVQRIFGSDSTDVSSSDHNGEHNGRTHWAEPNLAGSDSGSASDASFNYDHQVIIQLDGDETAQAAAEALYGKRPDRGAYAQDRDGSLLFFERNADGAVVPTGSPFEHWKSDRQVRLTFVGHGEVDAQASYFGGKTPAQFLQQLGGVLGAVGGNAERRVLINLVACGLEDTSSQQQHTYAGQVAQGLLDVARQAGLNPEHITLRAREGDVRVDAAGTKSSQGGVIQYDFRSADQRFVRSLDDLNTGTSTQTPVHHEPHSGESVEGSHDTADARKGILRGTTAHLRSEREALLLQLAEVIALRDKRNQGIASLQSPGEGLKLVPELVREATGGGYEVGFALLKSADHASINETNAHWVHTDNDAFMRWKERAQALGRKISAGVSRAGESAMEAGKYLFAPDTEGSPVHTIASAFLLQALIGPEGAILAGSRQSALEALSGRKLEELSADEVAALENRLTYLRVQQGVNYAALTSSLVNDGAELAKLFSILKDGNTGATGLTTGLAKGSAALGAIGVAFDIGSVVFAGIDLANAQTDRERAEALVNLGFSMVSTGMELGSIALGAMAGGAGSSAVGATTAVGSAAGVAGISSAATAAAVLGSLGVIVSGISIGAGALVHTIHQERDKIDGGLWMLEDYLAAAVDHAPEIPVSPLGMALETLKELEGRGLKDVVRGASIGGGLAGLIAILGGAIAEGIANATDSEDAKRWAAAMKIVEHAAEGKKLPAQPPTPSHHYGALESVSPGVFKFHDSLAATEFDLNTGKLTFAPVRVGALKHAIGAVVPGLSGKYLDLLAPFIKGDGASKTVDVSKLTDGSVLVLPHQPAVDFSYQLRTYGYANLDHEFPLLKAFEEATDDHEFYLWGTGGLTDY